MVIVDRVGSRLRPVVRRIPEADHIVVEEEESKECCLGMGKAGHIEVAEVGHIGVEEGRHRIEVVGVGSRTDCRTEGTGCYPKGRS